MPTEVDEHLTRHPRRGLLACSYLKTLLVSQSKSLLKGLLVSPNTRMAGRLYLKVLL